MKKIARLMTLALAVFTMASCEDVPSPYGTVTPPPTPSEVIPTGDGTATNPFNVTAAVAKCKEIGTTESTEKYYVTGVVVTAGAADAQYGNATFVISDEGSTAKFTCFQVLGTDGKKMEEGYSFDVGDVVIVYGPMYNYKGNTPETAGKGAAWVISRNGEPTTKGGGGTSTDQPKGNGTKDNPYNVSGVLSYVASLGADVTSPTEVYIKGKVKDITEQFGTQYGNATFTMVDEGFDAIFTAYRILYLGNKKYAEGDLLKTGDDVIVCGKVVNFKGNVPETSQGSAYLYSLNGNTGGGGGEVTPDQPKGNGTEGNPFNVAAAVAKCVETGETPTTESYYIKGIADEDYTIGSYKNLEVNIVDKEGCAQKFKVFRVKDKDGKDLKNGWKIAKGSTIIVYGPVVNYKGNTPETATGAYLVSVNGEAPQLDDGTSGGGSGGGDTGGNTLTVAASSLGLDNGVEVGSKTLSDGTTLTCDGGGNTNAPKYYTAGNGTVRMYPSNTMALNAGSKKIASIEIVCNEYQGTLYNASGNVTATSGTKAIDGASVKFTGINASSVTITNAAEGSGAATQIRWESLKITYAE